MPGYSGYQHEQVRAQVFADAPPAIPMSSANVVAGVAAAGSLLMLVGAWGPWVKLGFPFISYSHTVGGLTSGLDGRYMLGIAVAALLTAGTALTTGQSSLQIRQICAGALVGLGAIGLILVVHEWLTISDHVRTLNSFMAEFRTQLSQYSQAVGGSTSDPFLSAGDVMKVSRSWGLWLAGIASSITGLAGAYLFLARQP